MDHPDASPVPSLSHPPVRSERGPQRALAREDAGPAQAGRLRLAVLLNLAPRKLGSMEEWIVAVGAEARRRGHVLDVYSLRPVHHEVWTRLARLGVSLHDVKELERAPLRAARRLRRYDVLHVGYVGVREPVALVAYAAWPARVLYVDHASAVPGEDPRSSLRRLLGHLADQLTQLRLAGIAGVSDYVRERNRQRFGAGDKVQTLYNGVNLERFQPRRTPREGQRPFRLVTVAHLQRHKGVDVAIRALADMRQRNVELRVVGDGPEAGRLQQLAQELGVAGRVRLLGLRSDVEALLAQADVLVHPAIWQEAFGFTVAEAMACGLPVVATRTGGIPEVVEEGRSGLLVPPGDVEALALALDGLLQDGRARRRMGVLARARAVALFDLRACAARHLDWMERAASKERRE